jgi:hypothetical protein
LIFRQFYGNFAWMALAQHEQSSQGIRIIEHKSMRSLPYAVVPDKVACEKFAEDLHLRPDVTIVIKKRPLFSIPGLGIKTGLFSRMRNTIFLYPHEYRNFLYKKYNGDEGRTNWYLGKEMHEALQEEFRHMTQNDKVRLIASGAAITALSTTGAFVGGGYAAREINKCIPPTGNKTVDKARRSFVTATTIGTAVITATRWVYNHNPVEHDAKSGELPYTQMPLARVMRRSLS